MALSAWTDAFSVGVTHGHARTNTIVFGFLGIPPGLDSPVPLERFLEARPEIDLRYHELPFPTRSTSAWLGEADVGVCHQPPPDAEVWTHLLRSERRVALLPSSHALAGRDALTVADLLEETFMAFTPRSIPPGQASGASTTSAAAPRRA